MTSKQLAKLAAVSFIFGFATRLMYWPGQLTSALIMAAFITAAVIGVFKLVRWMAQS